MVSKVYSGTVLGIEGYLIEIEVDVAGGLPQVVIVGLPDSAVKESKDRVKSAIKNSGFQFPRGRIVVNLAPADIKKEGPCFDLPIALGILAASGQLASGRLANFIVLGELSLDGKLRPVKGVLPITSLLQSRTPKRALIVPDQNASEAGVARGVKVYPVKTLLEAASLIGGEISISSFQVDLEKLFQKSCRYQIDFSDVKGQTYTKRGLEVAAAGGHNVLMIGPPGSGKTMLAKRMLTIMPNMSLEEALETTKVHSIMGLVPSDSGLVARRPFRSPHHTASDVAIIGGGTIPKPGEVSLAHHGVLFLDELPEFHRDVLEVLRQPLEDGRVTISRATKALTFPSRFMLVCAMNPCPCGYFTDPVKECRCTPPKVQRYLSKVSGPLLDRIDIHLTVPSLKYKEITEEVPQENSREIKERVNKARGTQRQRFGQDRIFCNAQMNHKQINRYCPIGKEAKELFRQAMEEIGLSARAYDKIRKVARTIADLAGAEEITTDHLSEAIQYRYLDRNLW